MGQGGARRQSADRMIGRKRHACRFGIFLNFTLRHFAFVATADILPVLLTRSDCSSGCRAHALAYGDGTGLRAGAAVGRGRGADVFGRRFCSEALAIRRVICSWFALNCSTALALSVANWS
jgi:hypothetical protein